MRVATSVTPELFQNLNQNASTFRKLKHMSAISLTSSMSNAPNAAPPEFIAQLKERAQRAKLTWDEVVKQAKLSRTMKWRARKDGEVISIGSARKIERVLDKHEGVDHAPQEGMADLNEFIALGQRLRQIDPDTFESELRSLRKLAQAAELLLKAKSPNSGSSDPDEK